MEAFNTEVFVGTLAIVGLVIFVSALLSGVIERSGLPQVAVFLVIGVAIGPAGLGLVNVNLESPTLRVVATLSLALVLFTDAVNLDMHEVRRHGLLALRLLGPGTLLSTAVIGLAAWGLLGLPPLAALVLGAALASTDPVLLRGFLRRRDLPSSAKLGLRLESGLNDAVLLPLVVVAMTFIGRGAGSGAEESWGRVLLSQFLLGPGAGIIVGLLAVAALELVRRRFGVRRDYEALYALGVALSAFAAAEAVHGSGYLAAFAAGLTIAALDVELCDCFLEYGETTAEMALMMTFVFLGTGPIWSGLGVVAVASLAFAAIALVARVPIYNLALVGAGLDSRSRQLIAWFGPRGLSSLLLILLPVFAGLPGSQALFALCCLVVLLSIVAHGGTMMASFRNGRPRQGSAAGGEAVAERPAKTQAVLPAETVERPVAVAGLDADALVADPVRMTLEELHALRQAGQAATILDVRTDRARRASATQAQGAVRLPPDAAVERARELGLPVDDWLAAYCA